MDPTGHAAARSAALQLDNVVLDSRESDHRRSAREDIGLKSGQIAYIGPASPPICCVVFQCWRREDRLICAFPVSIFRA